MHSSFREIRARAMVNGATTLGGAYDQSLREGKTASALAMMFRTCARRYPAAAAGDYMLVGFVLQDGRIANTQVGPANDLAVCFGRAVNGLAFPPPPASHVPFAIAIKFDGATLQQVSPFPPASIPPPPPSTW